MTPELTILALAGLMHIAQFGVASYMANVDLGPGYTTSPRDRAPSREMRKTTARMLRAYDNHTAMFGLFAAGCLLVSLTGQSSGWTTALAALYLIARLAYIPAYAFGWQPWRSYIWLAALAACALLFLAALV
ncbi:MAPEG family protein [Aquimixticola soesokkakensis]|uniref:MAPEG family protein n=1 Tax=Aquimixticola soesokkakensis TaxID=1519096 RepID=A0A1Y5TIQ1_9RHOB|nr:MAPEG family protein [Aquimixticola soesokkakensis]SLN61264.1 MAPEG family protein [Aquimixticola soesokkakensis]